MSEYDLDNKDLSSCNQFCPCKEIQFAHLTGLLFSFKVFKDRFLPNEDTSPEFIVREE
jgi:hypothetical protein